METTRFTRAVAPALLAVSLVAAACAGGSGVRPTSTSTSAPATTVAASVTTAAPSAYGGTVVVGFADGGAPRTLNPLLDGPDAAVLDLLAPAVFAQGFDVDPASGLRVPDAMAGVPSVESGTVVDRGDGTMEVVFEVVDGAKWADGTPITAADLDFTYRLATDPTLPIRRDVADRYTAVVPGSGVADGRRYTVEMEIGTDPSELFEIIVPQHEVEGTDFASAWDDTMWVAGGPFVLADWEPGQFVELRRNPAYWKVTAAEGAPLPFLDRIVVRFYEPAPAIDPRLLDGFESGEVGVGWFARAEDRLALFEEASAAGANLERAPSGEWEHLNFQFGPGNRNPDSENPSRSYRQAVAHAIDRELLAEQLDTEVIDSIVQQFVPGLGDAPFDRYEFDLAEVDRLLAGRVPDVLLTVPGGDPTMLALGGEIVTMLRAAGFDAELQLEDADLFFGSTLDNGSWDVASWRYGSGTGYGSALRFMEFYDPDGLPFVGTNFFRWGTVDSRVDDGATRRFREIIDELGRTVDRSRVEELLVEAEEILAEEAVLVPLVSSGDVGLAYWPDAITGVAMNPAQGPLWNVDTWRVPLDAG